MAEAFRIHTFIAVSALHVEAKLKRTFDDVVEMAVAAVKHARNYTDDVEFSCEDAGRTGIDNICRIVEAAINAGATTVNILTLLVSAYLINSAILLLKYVTAYQISTKQ